MMDLPRLSSILRIPIFNTHYNQLCVCIQSAPQTNQGLSHGQSVVLAALSMQYFEKIIIENPPCEPLFLEKIRWRCNKNFNETPSSKFPSVHQLHWWKYSVYMWNWSEFRNSISWSFNSETRKPILNFQHIQETNTYQ